MLYDQELAAVEAFLATHQPRRFEPGATGDTTILLNWLNRNGYKATRKFGTLGNCARYVVDGTSYKLPDFLVFVSRIRAEKGLEPILLLNTAA